MSRFIQIERVQTFILNFSKDNLQLRNRTKTYDMALYVIGSCCYHQPANTACLRGFRSLGTNVRWP